MSEPEEWDPEEWYEGELRYKVYIPGEMNFFSMKEIEVDGIKGGPWHRNFTNLMFHLKSELDSLDNPSDTGAVMNWSPVMTSETHWLKCAVQIPVNSLCPICNKRGE